MLLQRIAFTKNQVRKEKEKILPKEEGNQVKRKHEYTFNALTMINIQL